MYVYETNIKTNSLGTNILEYFNYKEAPNKIKITGIDNKYVNHGKVKDLKTKNNLDIDYIIKDIKNYFIKECLRIHSHFFFCICKIFQKINFILC